MKKVVIALCISLFIFYQLHGNVLHWSPIIEKLTVFLKNGFLIARFWDPNFASWVSKLLSMETAGVFSHVNYWSNKCLIRVLMYICDALRDWVPFAQFKKREKHPRRGVTFSNIYFGKHFWKIRFWDISGNWILLS